MVGGQGNALVPVALLGWVPIVSWLFSKINPREAAAIAFALSLMFLPVASIPLSGLPDYTKVTATCAGILLAAWIYDQERILHFRIQPVDIPMLLWCCSPFLSSVFNGLGAYDGASNLLDMLFTWAMPYFVGRIYFTDMKGLNTLGTVVFVGGLIYIPFCFVEMIMSPQLHRWTYGFHQHSILQSMRGGGFRPMVYMEHGLMVAMWMVSASTLGIWLRYGGVLPKSFQKIPFLNQYLLKIPFGILLCAQLVTTALMKSTGAFLLFAIGLGALFVSNKMKSALLIWFLLCIPPTYIVTRTTGWWNGENLSSWVAEKFSEERAQSLQFRFDNETILVEKALEGTFFGWGGWNRSRVFDEDGRDVSVTDGLWIITLGTKGIFGLVLLNVVILLPVILLLYRSTPAQWSTKEYSAVSAMCILLLLYMIDNLLNGMINPIFMLFNGGICGLLANGIPESFSSDSTESTIFPIPDEEVGWIGDNVPQNTTRFL
ncbi:MAG: hypothetical protein OCC45_15160 [Desulfotalea sp.]